MSADDFQTKYASFMESMMQSAVAETRKLFETMVDELRAEISKIKKENEDLRTRCRQFEASQPAVYTTENNPAPGQSSEKRDTAVQCDLVTFQTMLVEQCQPMMHSPLQNQDQQYAYGGMEYGLQEHNYFTHEEETSQLAFIFVKQESPLKEEDVESLVGCGQVLSDDAGSPQTCISGTEHEGSPIIQVHSTEETDCDSQVAQNQSTAVPEPLLVAALKDNIEDKSEVGEKVPETGTQGEVATSQIHQPVPRQHHRDDDTSVNEETDVTVQQNADVHCTEEQLSQSTQVHNEAVCEELKNGVAEEEEATSKPNLPVRRRRGRPPKKTKQKEMFRPSSADVSRDQKGLNFPPVSDEGVEVTSVVNITSSKSSQASPVEPKETSSVISASVQGRANTALEDMETREVCSPSVSVVSLSSSCSSEKQTSTEYEQVSMEEEEDFQAPHTEVSSVSEALNTAPAESPQATSDQLKEHCTSVTLQDAMLLVEAMNQSSVDTVLPHVSTLQTVDEGPVEAQTATSTNDAQDHAVVVASKQQDALTSFSTTTLPVSSSAAASQTTTLALPHPLIASVSLCKQSKAAPQTIIVVPRPGSLIMPHKTAAGYRTHRPTALSKAARNKLLPTCAVARLPLRILPHSCRPKKTIKLTYRKTIPIVPLQSTTISTRQQSATPPRQKMTIVCPRLVPAVAPRKHESQTTVLTTKQGTAKPAAPVTGSSLISTLQELRASTSDDAIVSQNSDNRAGNLESPKQTVPASETMNAPTETHSSSEMSLALMPASVSPVLPPIVEQTLGAVVRLTRLPFSVSTEASVSVSRLRSMGYSEGPTIPLSEMSVASFNISSSLTETSIAVSVNTSQMSEPDNIQERASLSHDTCTILEEALVSGYDQPSAPFSAIPAVVGEPAPSLVKEIISDEVQENQSTGLIQLTSITSKDISDSHLQMSKALFLAQLAVSPTVQAPKKACSNDTEASFHDKKSAQKTSLVNRLRSQQKTQSQARRHTTKPEARTESQTKTVSPQKRRLQSDGLNDEDTTREGISHVVEDVPSLNKFTDTPSSISPRRSGLRKDGDRPKRSVSEPTCITSRRSKATGDSTPSLGRDGRGSMSVSPNRSCSTEESATPKRTTSTSVSPRRSISGRAGVASQNTKSCSVTLRRSSSIKESGSPKTSAGEGTSPKRTESTSICPRTSSLSEDGTSPEMSGRHTSSTLTKDSPRVKLIKKDCNSFSFTRNRVTTDNAINTKSESGTGSSSLEHHPKRTRESTPSKNTRSGQDGTGLKKSFKSVNAMKLAKAGRAKMRNSKLLTSRLAENPVNCEVVKKCKTKGVWFPPTLPEGEMPATGRKSLLPVPVKTETKTLDYPIIPVRITPIVSPLQPLAVIGRHLLKNQCGECGRIFSSNAALESHVSLHTGRRPFSCTLCGKCFTDCNGLKRHGRVHRNGRIHMCQQCGKGFVYRFGLTKHIQMVHGRLKPFICQICNKGFFTRRDVVTHIRIHTGEKPYPCNQCEKKFTRRVELNVHLRWHNGEKRHWCPYCGKGFLDCNNLKRHKYIHTGEKPYSCPHCPKHFSQTGHLKKHVKNVHKVK